MFESTKIEVREKFISYYKAAIRILILVSIFGVALLFKTDTQNIVIIKPILAHTIIYLVLLLYILSMIEKGNFNLLKFGTYLPIMVMLLFFSITAIITPVQFKPAAIEEMSRFLIQGFAYIAIVEIIHTKKSLLKLLFGLTIVSVMVCIYGLMQYYNHDFINWGQVLKTPISTFGNKNFLAGFQDLTFPIAVAFMLYSIYQLIMYFNMKKNRPEEYNDILVKDGLYGRIFTSLKMKIFFHSINIVFNLFLAYYHIFFTYVGVTRGAWVAYIFMLLIWLAVIFIFELIPRMFFKWGAVVILIAAVIVYIILPTRTRQNLITTLKSVPQTKRGTNSIRMIMWTGATRAWRSNKLIGTGVGVFQLVFPYYRPNYYHRGGVSHNTRHSHSEYLELLMETGIIGIGLFFWVIVAHSALMIRGILLLRNKNKFWQIIIVGLFIGQIGVLVHNVVSVNLRWTSCGYFFWISMGLSAAAVRIFSVPDYTENIKSKLKNISIIRPLFIGFFTVVFFLLCWYMVITYQSDYYLHRSNMFISQKRWDQAISDLKTSIYKNPYLKSPFYKLGFVYLNKHDLKNAKLCYENLMDISPRYAQIHYNYGLLWLNLFNTIKYPRYLNKAIYEFELATSIENNTTNNSRLADLYRNIQKWYNTIYRLRLASHIVSDDPQYRSPAQQKDMKKNFFQNIAAIYLNNLNDIDKAAQFYRKISVLFPNEYKYVYTLAKIQTQYKKYESAIKTYKIILRRSPTDYQANFKIGEIYEKYLNNPYQAFVYYYNSYIQMPQLNRLPNKSIIPTLQKNINYTISFLENLRKQNDKQYVEITDAIGWAYHILNQPRNAVNEFNKIKGKPNLPKGIKKHIQILGIK